MPKIKFAIVISVLGLALSASPLLAATKKKTKAKPTAGSTTTRAPSAPAVAPAGHSFLDGMLIAPSGTSVVLQKDGADDVTVIAGPSATGFSVSTFKFPKSYPNGSPYTLAIKTSSAGISCTVEKGVRGTIGLSPGFLRVGCDATFDLVSRSLDNTKFGTAFDSSVPVIGGDFGSEGRFVAFVSSAVGLGGSTGKKRQIVWRDRTTGQTKLASVGANGVEGDGDSFAPAISADGNVVAFESYAKNLVPSDTNGVRDVIVWNATTGAVVRVSVGQGGAEANGGSTEPSISGDGNVVAFSSGASNLAPGVQGINTLNVYRRDLSAGSTTLITKDSSGQGVGGSSASISNDGARVAFYSYSATLVAGDANGLWDNFVFDASNSSVKRVTLTASGGERNQGTESISRLVAPSISGNGFFVAFATTSSNVVPGDTNGTQDVFVVNVDTGAVQRVSTGSDGSEGNGDSPVGQGEKIGISFDGSWVTFSSTASNLGGSIVLKNLTNGEARPLSQTSGAGRPMVARNGGYVVFSAGAKLDSRYSSSGIFARYTGLTRCHACVG